MDLLKFVHRESFSRDPMTSTAGVCNAHSE